MKAARRITEILLLLLSAIAMFVSHHMIADPSGRSLNIPFGILDGTVFSDFAKAGWILFFTVGLFSLLSFLVMLCKTVIYPFFIILQGVIICIIVFVQLLLFRETFITQYIFLGIGILLIYLGALQNQRRIEDESRN